MNERIECWQTENYISYGEYKEKHKNRFPPGGPILTNIAFPPSDCNTNST